jgi:hypothetical protein
MLAIDTTPSHMPNRHASHSISHSGDSGLSSGRTAVNADISPIIAASTGQCFHSNYLTLLPYALVPALRPPSSRITNLVLGRIAASAY